MSTRLFLLVIGLIYIILGVLALVSLVSSAPPAGAPHVAVSTDYSYLFGIFPTNVVLDVAYIILGVTALLATLSPSASVGYSRFLFIILGLAAVAGFMPQADTVWGLMPIFSPDTWLHMGTSLLAGLFGWVAPAETYVAPVGAHASH